MRRLIPALLGLVAIGWAVQYVAVWATERIHQAMGVLP